MSAVAGFLGLGRELVKLAPRLSRNISTVVTCLNTGKKIATHCYKSLSDYPPLTEKIDEFVNNPIISKGISFVNNVLEGHETLKKHKITQVTAKAYEDLAESKTPVSEIVLKTIFTASCILLAVPEGPQIAGLLVASALIEMAAPSIDKYAQKAWNYFSGETQDKYEYNENIQPTRKIQETNSDDGWVILTK